MEEGEQEEPPVISNEYNLSFSSTDYRTQYSTEKQVWVNDNITFENEKGNGNNVANYSNPVRLYKNSVVKVSFISNMKKIVFNCNTNAYATALANSIGESSNFTETISGKIVTIEYSNPETFLKINSLSEQVRLDSIVVYA